QGQPRRHRARSQGHPPRRARSPDDVRGRNRRRRNRGRGLRLRPKRTGFVMSSQPTWIIGAAMTPFGRHKDRDLIDLGAGAALDALADADMTIQDIQVFAVGNAYESSGMVAQRIQKQIGQTGIETYNVFNACATGATAVRLPPPPPPARGAGGAAVGEGG